MPLSHRAVFAAASLLLIVSACSRGDASPTTTLPAPTVPPTTQPAPTTTQPPSVEVTSASALPGDLADQVEAIYLLASGVQGQAQARQGLVDHLRDNPSPRPAPAAVAVEWAAGTIQERQVAVVTAGDDVILAVSPGGARWEIVGADLVSLGVPAWYGHRNHQIFVIGSDARTREDPIKLRADSLHIVTVAADASSASIVGLPRDSWVEAPYGRNDKITNTMASRGPEVTTEAAETLTSLDFDGYIVTGFAGFVRLVNDMGGFTIEIPFAMNEPKSDAFFQAGVQMIDGFQALAFARNRTLAGGDFTRSFHQGVIMQWGLQAAQERGPLHIPEFLESLDKHTFTDLTPAQLLQITAAALAQEDPFEIPNLVAPGSPGRAGSASVVYLSDGAFEIFDDLSDRVLDVVPE